MNDIRIIINADDCGKNETVNKAIEKCILAGKLSSTTVMATGEDIVGAKRLFDAYADNVSFGCHITLDEGSPMLGSQLLLDKGYIEELENKYYFTKKIRKDKLICGEVKDAIIKEVSAQIEYLLDNGFSISHFDSHHHIHTTFGLIWLIPELTKKYSVFKYRRMRNLMPPSLSFYLRQSWNYLEQLQMSSSMTTDYFASYMDIVNNKDLSYLRNGSCVEIMCHPGHEGASYIQEIDLLLKSSEIIKGYNCKLINYTQI